MPHPSPATRLRQAGIAALACGTSLVLVALALAGASSLAAGWPLLLVLTVLAAIVAAALPPMGPARALLLGIVAALVGVAGVLAYALLRI